MAQRPDDFYADLGRFGASDELHPIYERLDADARAWSATVGDETALIAFARSLPRRSREETMRMQSQPGRPEWDETQRLPYTNPDYRPRQRPSQLRTWVAVIAAALVVALLGGSLYALQTARNGGTTGTPTATIGQPTATPLPTATATTTLPTVTAASVRTLTATQYSAMCPKIVSADPVGYYQIDDLYLAVELSGLNYLSLKLPMGTPLKPFKLGSDTDPNRGLPPLPKVNPDLRDMGIFVTACNVSKTLSHRIDGVTVRVERFTPFTGDLNSYQHCDGYYQNGQPVGTGCGGGATSDVSLSAVFAANAGAGAVVLATLDAQTNASLPFIRQPGQNAYMFISVTPPKASGTYRFSFSVTTDGARLPFVALPDDLLLAPARKWTGDACATPAMQSQIPSGSTDAYICPES